MKTNYKGNYYNAGLWVAVGNSFLHVSLQGMFLDTGSDFLKEALEVGRGRLPALTPPPALGMTFLRH
jgi:hypothetical protein